MPNSKYVTREDAEASEKGYAKEFKEIHNKLDYITGKIDGMSDQKKSDWQSFGIIGAILMALWNMFTK